MNKFIKRIMIEQNQKHIPHAQYTNIEIEEDFLSIII